MKKIRRLLVANRSEIAIRVFRSAHELGIRTVAVYSFEDRFALHRFKADEAYLIGKPGEPIRTYLNIDALVELCRRQQIDAVHPGYGFLSENAQFAEACAAAGVIFVGPSATILASLGDKTAAREIAKRAGVPILGGTDDPLKSAEEATAAAERLGYPVILKAAHGGGGRGMRVVERPDSLATAFEQATRESLSAFGSPDIFLEKFIPRARHIEVQLLGDRHGNLVHLFERDCSVQRRHQKVVELAPAPMIDPVVRAEILEAALSIGRAVDYQNAGTVEFLLDDDTGKFYFIEVNPRIQVEHTVTEEITGIDLVKSQILVAQGTPLADPDIGLPSQESVKANGFALQCRVTTEDPTNGFLPDYGRVAHYRSAGGMGIRLDAGSAFSGALVTPFYDSLLVKVTARGRRFIDATRRMERCLSEFRVRGVKTNLPFLLKLMKNQTFLEGRCTTRFIDQTPELLELPRRRDRATKLLTFMSEVIIAGNPEVQGRPVSRRRDPAPQPVFDRASTPPPGTRQRLQELGPQKFAAWVRDQKQLLITDTTFRDAPQSLLATRLRTVDMVNIADAYARLCPELFSLEMWGGATFDTAMRFLHESSWDRLAQLRKRVPNLLLQMLLRASNAVGYTNYPDNVVQAFIREAAAGGIDVFRIFDALNWTPNMKVAMDAVLETGALCEAAICYTGDILDPKRTKYDLKYYITLARELEKMGAHLLAIKDMAGLCKPAAAGQLIRALKQEIGIPIHFHTHDTAGIQAASILEAAAAGVDIIDAAMAPFSGGTSQPNLNTLVEALRSSPRDTKLESRNLDALADYWRGVREFYTPFESEVLPATADLYRHEMPGGQYTNLYQQARALGLADRWSEVCQAYADVNQMLGDIVKVTPTSKAVGDMALFMVANQLTVDEVENGQRQLAYPASVIDLVAGRMGQPPGGFPPKVAKQILRDVKPVEGRPGESLPPADFAAAKEAVQKLLFREPTSAEVVTWLLYPKVFEQFVAHYQLYSDISSLPTPVFFYGLLSNEEIAVEIEQGKTLIIKYLTLGQPHADGRRTVFFEVNGVPRDVTIVDPALKPEVPAAAKADPADPRQVGASMPGMVVALAVSDGEGVVKGQKLLTLEAMKMETTLSAPCDGRVARVLVQPGSQVEAGDLLLALE
ncbi:MAG: pyruvate carboxylase [Planctomycetia bacterium]|nr:pyruvate carboxylase [Planctomycetia bacterium]